MADMSYNDVNGTIGDTLNFGSMSSEDAAALAALEAETYDVFDLDFDDIPAVYRNISDLEKRDWKTDGAYAVVGGAVAATGLFAKGVEFEVLRSRQWMLNEDFHSSHPDIWKRAQTVTLANKAALMVWEIMKGGVIGTCAGRAGDWAGLLGNAFISGASTKPVKEERRIDLHRKAWGEGWKKDARSHDELKKRGDHCNPTISGMIDTSSIDAYPAGATLKMTCKGYRDFGWCDQLDVAKKWMLEMVLRGGTEGTFTVYNRQSAIAHMRCSVGLTPYFFNHHECPYELPGDEDGDKCKGCPYRT